MALIKGARETARRFYAFVQGPVARRVLARYGFVLPDAMQ
jgi:ABC-type molybdate transport system substrate-binding protein